MSARRIFIGLRPPPAAATRIFAAASSALDAGHWRLHAAADLHLTLCFLGSVPEERLSALESALETALEGVDGPWISVAGSGAFPSAGTPRVVWAGIQGAPAELARLAALRQATVEAVHAARLTCDERSGFTPHLTLARPRGGAGTVVGWSVPAFAEGWSVDAVHLCESLGARGTAERYPSLRCFPLPRRSP